MGDLEAFSNKEKFFETILDFTNDGVVVADRKFTVRYINRAVERLTGLKKEEVIGKHCRKIVPRLNCEKICPSKKTFGEGTPHVTASIVETPFRDKIFLINSYPLFNENDEIVGCAEIIKDITERNRVEEALKASEKKYLTLVEKGNDGIVIIQNGRLMFVNPKMTEITGFPREEAIGKSFTDFIAPENKKLVLKTYKQRLKGMEVPAKYEIEILSKDGNKIPVEVNASLIVYKGQLADMAIIRDITERKHAEEKLRESQEFLKSIIENSGDAIVTTDGEGKITLWNKGAEELYGYKSKDVLGKPIGFVYPDELKEERKEWQKTILAGKTIRNIRTMIYNSRGELIHINLTLSPMRDIDGNPIGTVGISKDISHVIKAEKRLREKFEESET